MTSKKHKFYIFAKIKYMKKTIAQNLSWLLICSVVAKMLGGMYRIVLTRLLGANIGLYQIVFSVYSFLIVLISSGVPLAISKLVSSKKNALQQQRVLQSASAVLVSVGLVLALVLAFGSKGLSLLQGEHRIYWCYIILSPALVFSAGTAILRGYLQGKNNFRLPAIAGIIEQISKIAFGLGFMLILRRFYILGALFGAMVGSLVGDIISFIFLQIAAKSPIKFKYSIKDIKEGRNVFKYAFPIMLYSLIVPLSNFIDSFLVIGLLKLRLPRDTATLLYGLQTGVVGSLVSIPSIFSFALASVLMPSLSSDYASNNIDKFNKKVSLSFKLVLFITLPCAIYLAINASNIINLVYGSGINGFGVNGQYVSRNLLLIASVGVVFASLNQLSAVILQNLNQKSLPIINLVLGVACKLIIEMLFIPSGRLGIYAYGIAVSVCFVVSGVLNLYAVERYSGNIIKLNYLSKQILLAIFTIILLTIFKVFDSTWVFILGSIFSGATYLIGAYIIKLFTKQDVRVLINSE